jgi:hypothetical protein
MLNLKSSGSRLIVLSSVLLLVSNCRTTLKPITDSAEAVPIEMQIIGLRPADQERTELVYTLSRCGLANVNGVKGDGNKVTFQAQGVKKDDQCDVRVETGNTDIGVANWKDEAGLMYIASRVKINSTEGKLYGLAFVQQKYVSPPTIPNTITPAPVAMVWKLKIDLTAPNAVSNCTCTIKCSPALTNNVAMYESESQTSGQCTFANLVNASANTISCTSIMAQCGSEFYLGTWPAGTLADGSNAGEVSLPPINLTRGAPDATSDATIEVIIPQ